MTKQLFPTVIGKARVRDASANGKFFDIECAKNVKTAINTSENVKELVCWSGDSVVFEKPTGQITLNVIKTKNPDLLGELLGLTVTATAAGSNTITDEKNIFGADDKIELLQRSNDDNWVTSLVVKSSDGSTTYVLDTDYTVAIAANKTVISIKSGGAITAGDTVLVSGSVTQNANKEIEIKSVQREKKKFTIELFGERVEGGGWTTILATPVTLSSEYMIEMIDMFEDGDIAGSDLTFDLSKNGSIKMKDENV